MAEERARRRLAAILAADVVGFSRLMEQDDAGTLAALKVRRATILQPIVTKHSGRIVKVMGDGVLVEFGSAVNAVNCAVELQAAMGAANADLSENRQIILRIGISLGDVLVEGSDLYGDGVNIAARLEALTEAGSILVSHAVLEHVDGKLPVLFHDQGERTLKNIARPVHVYRVEWGAVAETPAAHQSPSPLDLPDKTSIVVLPFKNLSGDPEHEFFADGLTEDLITDLSRVGGLFVIASNSSFAYKGQSVDVRHIARRLGVRYIIEGNARRAAGRLRINVQLIDAIAGGHIWAERFDRALEDVFSVQDEVVAKIVEALLGCLPVTPAVDRKRPTNMEAYDLCVRGRALVMQSQGAREARLMFERAIMLEPDLAEAHRLLALTWAMSWVIGGEPKEPNLERATAAAQKALALQPNDAGVRWVHATVLARRRQLDLAEADYALALKLDSNCADAWAMLSELRVLCGQSHQALIDIRQALRLNPHPPGWYYWLLGQAQYLNYQYEEAVQTLRREETYRLPSRRTLAASLAQLGRLEEARHEGAMFMANNPHFTIKNWLEAQAFRDEAASQPFVDGYRKAGLPE